MRAQLEQAIGEGRMGGRLWLYATYHCNLACSYCLTESHPRIADRRVLERPALLAAVAQARELGLTSVGFTGGEVFMLPWFPEALVEAARLLPVLVLTNGTLLTERLLARLAPLAELPASFQLSLDAADAGANDALRGDGSFADVVEAIPRLLAHGLHVRLATTVDRQTPAELERLCTLHRRLGVTDDDHVVRTVVRRGKAAVLGFGAELGPHDVLPELTVTAEGVFLHPFAPTVVNGVTDLDLRVATSALPLERALQAFLGRVDRLPSGDDVVRNVR